MATFLIGLVILIGGGLLYGKFCENVFGPDDRETPAYAKQDGVDYVPMQTWKNSLINLLNIAGTGPILGPIQGILFGPIAFLARVKGTFNKYSQLRSMSGMNGAQVAQRVLQAAGIYDVQVRHVSGSLTDHYDPRTKTVNLSDPVYNATSVAALGVAAHECGHAIQHAKSYAPLSPAARFADSRLLHLLRGHEESYSHPFQFAS